MMKIALGAAPGAALRSGSESRRESHARYRAYVAGAGGRGASVDLGHRREYASTCHATPHGLRSASVSGAGASGASEDPGLDSMDRARALKSTTTFLVPRVAPFR